MAAIAGYQGGYNVRSANYFQPVTMQNNYGPLLTVFNVPPFNQRIAFMASGIAGLADVEIDTGTTYSAAGDSNMSIVSQSAGAMRINIPDDGALTRYLSWTGTVPTKFKVTRVGIAGDTAPEWIAGLEDTEIIRDLDMGLQNFIPTVGPIPARNTPSSGFYLNDTGVGPNLPYQDISNGVRDYANAKPIFKTYWSVIGVDVDDAYVTAKATYERDTIPSRIRIAIELGNELHWNGALPGVVFQQLDSIRKGYYNNPPYNAPNAPIAINTDFGGSPAGSVSPSSVTAGSYVLYNAYGVGNKIYYVKQNAPAGTVIADSIASTENAYFRRETWELSDAGRQYHSVRFNQIIEIYRSVFGETRFQSQIFPVIMRQAGGLIGALDIEQNYVPGYWAKIKGAGNNFYFYHADDLDTNTVTAASLEASFRAQMSLTKGYVQQTVADALSLGLVPCFYEGGPHVKGPYQGLSGTNAYSTAWNEMFGGELGRAFMRDIAYFVKTTVPGLVVKYDLVGSDLWSLKLKWSDTSNKRLVGWKEGLALAGDIPVDPPVDPDPPIDPPTGPSIEGSGMTIIGLYGGPIKRDIIKSAYGVTGQSDVEYALTPEEYDQGLRLLNMILARWVGQWGVSLGYNFPPPGTLGSADEESGIPWDAEDAVVQSLARQLAPNIGKTLSPEANRNYAEAIMALRSAYAALPQMQMRPDTPRGAGARRGCLFGPFFRAKRSADEIIQ